MKHVSAMLGHLRHPKTPGFQRLVIYYAAEPSADATEAIHARNIRLKKAYNRQEDLVRKPEEEAENIILGSCRKQWIHEIHALPQSSCIISSPETNTHLYSVF